MIISARNNKYSAYHSKLIMSFSLIQLMQLGKGAIEKLLRYSYLEARLTIFRLLNRKAPLDKQKANEIGLSVLSGKIITAKSYKNLGSKHIYLAVIREDIGSSCDRCLFLLEQFGNTYRIIWRSTPFFSNQADFDLIDINRDGVFEVVYEDRSFGTGAGQRILNIYMPKENKQIQLSENYDWQNTTEPIAPEIRIDPEVDGKLSEAIETLAVKKGFLQEKRLFENSLRSMEQSWHAKRNELGKENTLDLFEGEPHYSNSVSATLDSPNILWTAYFKGPLIGYLKKSNQHFIAYSPLNIYSWVTSIAFYDAKIWLAIHDSNTMLSFEYADGKGKLETYDLDKIPENVLKLIRNGDHC